MKKTWNKGLKGGMLRLSVLPVAVLALLVMIVSAQAFYRSMTDQVEEEMKKQCRMVQQIYDQMAPGEFGIQMNEDASYNVLKGETDITENYQVIDDMKDIQGMEVTIFCKGIRVLTTLEDQSGNRLVTTKVSPVVQKDIETSQKAQFYRSVTINDVDYFAYYEPIILSDGTMYGMIGICRPVADIRATVFKAIIPIALLYLLATIGIGCISVNYSKKVIRDTSELQRFMKAVATADFTATIDDKLLHKDNELGEIAQIGKKMQQSLCQLVEYDALTGLNNRRYGDNRLTLIKDRAQKMGMTYCVGIGDIDFFKKVNDTYGHEAGDEVLKHIADILKRTMIGKGTVARWGGEEFLIIFEMDRIKETRQTLENMLNTVRNTAVTYQEQVICVTMSIGICETDGSEPVDDILRKADDLLYLAKTSGRNQIQWKAMEHQNEEDVFII